MSHEHDGHRQRLRERFITDASELDDITMLELLLTYAVPRKDTRPLATSLIERFGGMQKLVKADTNDIMAFGNVSQSTALLIKMIPELSRRAAPQSFCSEPNYFDYYTAGKFLAGCFNGIKDEYVMLACLTENGILLDATMLYRGDINGAGFKIRAVTERALMFKCHDILLAHNHPFGPIIPSAADLDSTARITASLSSNSITLHEHYVIYKGSFAGIISNDYRI